MTAVQWLYKELALNNNSIASIKEIIYRESEIWKQAKEMEKQQMFGFTNHHHVIGEGTERFFKEEFELWYNETYGSKGTDYHIVETNEMVDQVPDVRKMVEWIDKEILLNPHYADSPRLKEGANMVKVKLQQYIPTSYQTERMYSEVIEFAKWIRNNPYVWNYPDKLNDTRTTEELFEQFKKK